MHLNIDTDKLKASLIELKAVTKNKYVNFGTKLLVLSLNPITKFAKHLIELQGKNPNSVPITLKDAVESMPVFRFHESAGWGRNHFKDPQNYHPILKMRKQVKNEGGLQDGPKVKKKEVPLQRTLAKPVDFSPEIYNAINTETVSKKEKEKKVVFEKASEKKSYNPPRKVVRFKKGIIHRVED